MYVYIPEECICSVRVVAVAGFTGSRAIYIYICIYVDIIHVCIYIYMYVYIPEDCICSVGVVAVARLADSRAIYIYMYIHI